MLSLNSKHVQHVKIYIVNLITRLAVITLFHTFLAHLAHAIT
jgi:hypothetical protein